MKLNLTTVFVSVCYVFFSVCYIFGFQFANYYVRQNFGWDIGQGRDFCCGKFQCTTPTWWRLYDVSELRDQKNCFLMDIIAKHFNQGCSSVDLHTWQFYDNYTAWYPKLATDLEMLGYSISFDGRSHRKSFFMNVAWAKKALLSRSVNYTKWQKDNPQFSDEDESDSDSEMDM